MSDENEEILRKVREIRPPDPAPEEIARAMEEERRRREAS